MLQILLPIFWLFQRVVSVPWYTWIEP